MRMRVLVLCLLLPGLAPAIRSQATDRPVAHARFDAAIDTVRRNAREAVQDGLPGLSIAVGVDGVVVFAEGFGWADLEQRVPVRTVTRFRIGSVSKPLTAAAVGLLVEQGDLDLDAPVQNYVPTFPDKGSILTTRLVAGHLGGIRHYRGVEMLSATDYPTVAAGLAIFQDDPLLSPPGEKYSYSSYGWNLVSAVVEEAAGQEFLSFMRERVFDPLGMFHTTADQNHRIVHDRARPYVTNAEGELQNAPYVDNSYKWAGGGFLSTPEDLVRFGMAHLQPGFLDADTLTLLHTSLKTTAGEETGYGIGWRIGEGGGRRTLGHGGGSVGGTTRFTVYPDDRVVVALASNLSQARLPGPEAVDLEFLR